MDVVLLSFLFLLSYAIFISAKIAVQEIFIDEDIAYYIEAVACVIFGILYYFSLISYEYSPILSWFCAAVYSIFCVLMSWGLPQLSDYILGWGDQNIPLPISFSLLNIWILFLCFLPSGLGTTIGVPDLFAGKIFFFIVIAITQAITTSLIIFIANYFEDETATLILDILLCQGIAILIWSLLSSQMPRGQTAVLTTIILTGITVEMIGIFYLASHYLEIFDIQENFWKQRGYILTSQISVIAIIYIFPLIKSLFSFIDSFVS